MSDVLNEAVTRIENDDSQGEWSDTWSDKWDHGWDNEGGRNWHKYWNDSSNW